MEEVITVAAAIIEHKFKYLICKRASHVGNPGLWEFPGGKAKEGESLQQCLTREIKEELNLNVEVKEIVGSTELIDNGRHIKLFGLKTLIEQEPKISDLKDHTDFKWVEFDELSQYAMTQAELGLIHSLRSSAVVEREVAYVNPMSLAKFYGVAYGVIGFFMGFYIIVATTFIPSDMTFIQRIGAGVTMPFANTILGFIFGAVIAGIYNLFASVLGGIKLRFR